MDSMGLDYSDIINGIIIFLLTAVAISSILLNCYLIGRNLYLEKELKKYSIKYYLKNHKEILNEDK